MASVLLVFQVGQPRIWLSMSRDGLLPRAFSKVHRRFKTPYFSTIIAGILVAIPSLFMNLTEVTDLTSIGTLFAFVLVSGGVLVLDRSRSAGGDAAFANGFRVPYINSRYFLPLIWIGIAILLYYWNPPELQIFNPVERTGSGIQDQAPNSSGFASLWFKTGNLISLEFPILIFIIGAIFLTFFSIWKQFSLIPVLGLLTNFYLMAQLGITNWMRFLIWLAIGLILFFTYGLKHSRLRNVTRNA